MSEAEQHAQKKKKEVSWLTRSQKFGVPVRTGGNSGGDGGKSRWNDSELISWASKADDSAGAGPAGSYTSAVPFKTINAGLIVGYTKISIYKPANLEYLEMLRNAWVEIHWDSDE